MQTRRTKKNLYYGVLVCAIAGIFYAYEYLLRILPGALQNELMFAFGGVSAGVFGQVASLYYFAYSPMQLPVGVLMDRYGPQKVLTFACLVCSIGSWMFAQTHILWLASLGRFFVGFGSAFAFVGILFLGHHWLPRRFFSLLAGLVTTFAMFTLMFGVVRLTSLVTSVGINHLLSGLAIIGFALTGFIYLVVRDSPDNKAMVHHQPWNLFFKEVGQVLIDKKVWIIGLIGALMYTALSVFGELWGKVYLEQAHHLSSLQAAKSISMIFLGWALGAPTVGYVSDHTGHRYIPIIVSSLLGSICISIVLYTTHLSWSMINFLLFCYGVCTSTEIIVFVMGKEISKAKLAGTVFAAVNMIVMLGGVILQPIVGYILDWSANINATSAVVHIYSVRDYRWALSFLPASLILVIIALIIFHPTLNANKK